METFNLRQIQSMLGLSRGVIAGLVAAGFVRPARGPRREYRFTFQDVVLLRTALHLQQARIPARRIVRSLRRLQASLPAEMPISGLRIAAVGSEVAVREGARQWHVDSGQLLFDFELQPATRGQVRLLERPSAATPDAPPPRDSPEASADEWFGRGAALEASDPSAAEAAYRRALQRAPEHLDATLNLGVLLCDAGRGDEAVALYRRALRRRPDEPLLHFNLGVALDDAGSAQQALAAYEQCLRLDAAFADAHYNAARLHEALGDGRLAIRHYSEYRRLQR